MFLKKIKKKYVYIICIALLAASLFKAFDLSQKQEPSSKAAIGGDFILTNQLGETVSLDQIKGKHTVLFFGFTSCPMICPTSLNNISQAYEKLSEDQQEALNVVFITVDPERDTVEVMADYLESFSAPIIGLTGSEDDIAEVISGYRIYAQKAPEGEYSYTMNHSTIVYILDKKAEFLDHFAYNLSVEDIYNKLIEFL